MILDSAEDPEVDEFVCGSDRCGVEEVWECLWRRNRGPEIEAVDCATAGCIEVRDDRDEEDSVDEKVSAVVPEVCSDGFGVTATDSRPVHVSGSSQE